MTSNAFGGHIRIGQLDLAAFKTTDTTPEQLILLSTIADAAHDYVFFGLGRNGTSADEFAGACRYFFEVRLDRPLSYDIRDRIMILPSVTAAGKHVIDRVYLTDQVLLQHMFDTHYSDSGMDRIMSIERFLRMLEEKRRRIITSNWSQVREYVLGLRAKDLKSIEPGRQLALDMETISDDEMIQALVRPKSMAQLANLIYQPHRPARRRRRYKPQVGMIA
ncbi:hypothetical protein [Silvibacterium dinghuense]|uniref:Uncharacterized protein n=1 Tax=Silvibacterium dinghuense TaxID=1560006 RepID=A0A4Q1SDH9_9BACT|nr:hypothetical protein [Silvibacterium dinghuense]RXS95125.1 hypothetical protein ESZ00_10970 [Silvibacterium dinghuense]